MSFAVTKMIFISGPVIVSPLDKIIFHAYLCDHTSSSGAWLKIADCLTREIEPDNKNSFTYRNDHDKTRIFEILEADKDDSGTYQFSLGNLKSNKIRTFVDGKYFQLCYNVVCLRIFMLCFLLYFE